MIALLVGLSRRYLIELRRYAFDTTFQFGGFLLLFTLVFWGARGIGGSDIRDGDTLPSIVVGFIVLSIILFSFGTMASWTTQEATLGTLEQVAMSPFGLLAVLVAEYVAAQWMNFVIIGLMLIGAMAISGEWLHLDAVTLVPLVALLLVQMLGISLAFAGAAVVFKRVVSMMNVLQFVFLALISLPIDDHPELRYMPVSLASHLIRETTVQGTGLTDLDGGDLALLVALAVAYLLLGSALFLRMERVARDRGLLGVH